jgi:hypothetical protein
MELLGLWLVGGIIVAITANSKEMNPIGWFFYGSFS